MLMRVWPQLWPLIKPAYEMDDQRPDLLKGIRQRDFQVWCVYSDGVVIAGIVTRLQTRVGTSGSEKHCRIWLVGGDRMSEWAGDFIAKLTAWARTEGCDALVGAGRKGWARVVRRFGGVNMPSDGLPAWRLDIAEARHG